MDNEIDKKEPTGSIIYLLHCHYKGKTYSFIGNRQTFGDLRSTSSHFEDISYMFLPPINDDKDEFMLEYCLKVLQYYPNKLNYNHCDQVFLNDEKRRFIKKYRSHHYLNNIQLNDDCSVIMDFIKYNKKVMKEIKRWDKKEVTLYDVCLLAKWIKDKDIDIINSLPRFMWLDEYYKGKIEELGLYPTSETILKVLMIFKDRLVDKKFLKRLQTFGNYLHTKEQGVEDMLKEWTVGRYYSSKKKVFYKDSLDYINKFMFVFCKKNNYKNCYDLVA